MTDNAVTNLTEAREMDEQPFLEKRRQWVVEKADLAKAHSSSMSQGPQTPTEEVRHDAETARDFALKSSLAPIGSSGVIGYSG